MGIFNDGRMHSTVFYKSDPRRSNIFRTMKKSDIVKLYDIDCTLLFRIQAAHIQFDMIENHRPYIVMYGNAEGVYLEPKTGLLFPNACDQLDFRTDYPVEACINYDLSDAEIATLSANGMHNNDYTLQGNVFGHILEIPCKIDYFAAKSSPLTYVSIQDQYCINTNTRRTGYRTLVATFIPYDLQKHNTEDHPEIKHTVPKTKDSSAIRQRDIYDAKPFTFDTKPTGRELKDGASFVEVAQNKMQERLQDAMRTGDIMGTEAKTTSNDIVDSVKLIKEQAEKTKRMSMLDVDNDASKLDVAGLDAKTNDMAERMIYAGANDIEVNVKAPDVEPLVDTGRKTKNDVIMTTPITEVGDVGGEQSVEEAERTIEDKNGDIHKKVFDAEKTATDIVQKLSRKDMLLARKKQREASRQKQLDAANNAGSINIKTDTGEILPATESNTPNKDKMDDILLKDDILSGNVDIDEVIKSIQ